MDMPDIPLQYVARLGHRAVVEQVALAIRSAKGFSLLRLGNGEGCVLGWPNEQGIAEALEIWFGRTDLNDSELDTIATGLHQAIRRSDVLGLPTRFQSSQRPDWMMVFRGIERHGLCSGSQMLTDHVVHWYLQWSGALALLLRGLDQISIIGCRDIGPQIADAFGVGSVRTYLVRGEAAFPGPVSKPHWPDGFVDLSRALETVRPGDVFLVGAGVLGKIYCDCIKTRGGIAIDVGSLLDSWAQVPSRARYPLNWYAFSLEYLKSAKTDWPEIAASLAYWAAELHARDATVTL